MQKQSESPFYYRRMPHYQPNHVHLLLRIREKSPDEFHRMAFIVKKIMSITAHDINQQLGRQGTFWQREYYDYCVRNGKEILTITNYIMMNPVKAGLVAEPDEWKYTWLNESLLV